MAGTDETFTLGGTLFTAGDLRFVGNYTQAIRAPSIVELFAPVSQVFSAGQDPCDNRNINDGPVPADRRANCIAAGIADPDSFVSNVVNATAIGSSGGNDSLSNEVANSWTVGLAWLPSYVPGLQFSADYILSLIHI